MQLRVTKDWEALAMLTKQTDIVVMHFLGSASNKQYPFDVAHF